MRVDDLFFAARISATADALGVRVEAITSEGAEDQCRALEPDLVILDLHGPGEPLVLARALKANANTRAIPIVGFYSHVDQALRNAALEAGVDRVLPRSAFTAQLAGIIGGEIRT